MNFPKNETIYISFNEGGLGDNVARLSAVKYIIDNYSWVTPRLIMPEYFVNFAKQHFPDIWIRSFEEFDKTKKLVPITSINSDISQVSIMRQHLVEHAFSTILDLKPEKSAYDYVKTNINDIDISEFNLPEKYIVITCMYTAKVREFPPKVVNDILDYLKFADITPVFLGKTKAKASKRHTIKGKTDVDMNQGINLMNKTDLLEATAIMGNSICTIGVDNGLLHLAATTDTDIVAGFTTVDPLHRRPQRNGVEGWKFHEVIPELDCKFCQSKLNFVYDFRFTNCYEKHMKCVKEMSAEPFIEKISKILDK